ncbi:SHOCT domain-containing protein [Streptomyces sp. 8N706]|uniref:SHOCT domain-containing protein n=1 Tax=Streptomyces sp. 8N706 TaxID=3457416 RepID=UPI003FD535B3
MDVLQALADERDHQALTDAVHTGRVPAEAAYHVKGAGDDCRAARHGKGRSTTMSNNLHLAYDYPLLGAFWTMMWIFLWILWIVLVFRVIGDVFRDDSLSGWGKTGWTFFVMILPFLGIFVYLIARGRDMGKREQQSARARQESLDAYIRGTAASTGTGRADELVKLSELKNKGDITEAEFQHAKQKVLTS